MLRYPVKLERDTNGTILAGFPDVPEAHTFGDDREEALARAADALETALMGYIEDRQAIPEPSPFKRGPYVALPALTEAKLALYSAMRVGRINKTELARRLNCHLPQVDRLLDLRHGSRLDQLEAAFRALGKQLSVEIRDIVTKRRPLSKHTAAGRRLVASAKQALAWTRGEKVPGVRVTMLPHASDSRRRR